MSTTTTAATNKGQQRKKANPTAAATAAADFRSGIARYDELPEIRTDIELARSWLQTSEVQQSRGGVMAHTLYNEIYRCNAKTMQLKRSGKGGAPESSNNSQTQNQTASDPVALRALEMYQEALCETFDAVSGVMFSALHRSNAHYHANRLCVQREGSRVVDDDEEPLTTMASNSCAMARGGRDFTDVHCDAPNVAGRTAVRPTAAAAAAARAAATAAALATSSIEERHRSSSGRRRAHIAKMKKKAGGVGMRGVNVEDADEEVDEDVVAFASAEAAAAASIDELFDAAYQQQLAAISSDPLSGSATSTKKQGSTAKQHSSPKQQEAAQEQQQQQQAAAAAPKDSTAAPAASASTTASGTDADDAAASQLNVEGEPKSSKELAEEKRYVLLMTLLRDKKVSDEKGNLLNTIGPFTEPRIVGVRSARMGTRITSRRRLTQRALVAPEKSSDEDMSEEAMDREMEESGPLSDDAAQFLQDFLNPASLDSLKKIAESAKATRGVKLAAAAAHGSSQGDPCASYISEIVRCAARMGAEQLYLIVERSGVPLVGWPAVAGGLRALAPDSSCFGLKFFDSMPSETKPSFGKAIGLYREHCTPAAMYERMISLGFCAVLTNLRSGPLKKLAQELGIKIDEHATSVAQCEAIVFAAFPRERVRLKLTLAAKAERSVVFTQIQHEIPTGLDLGTIAFEVSNVSTILKDQERHYSPEFEYGGFKWSLLVMGHKDNLAVYLCQTETVSCKFMIWLLHRKNHLKSYINEGTQHFTCASPENDWGFNNILSFEALLDPANGFIDQSNDSILIVCGIVLVEPKARFMPSTSGSSVTDVAAGAPNNNQQQPQQPQQQQQQQQAVSQATGGGAANAGGAVGAESNPSAIHSHTSSEDRSSTSTGYAAGAKGGDMQGQRGAGRGGTASDRQSANDIARELLETERLEALRKKLKQDFTRLHKDEERQRRDIASKHTGFLATSRATFNAERQRIVSQQQRAEKEVARERERQRHVVAQNRELAQRHAALQKEEAELPQRLRDVGGEVDARSAEEEALAADVAALDDRIAAAEGKKAAQAAAIAADTRVLEELTEELSRLASSPTVVAASSASPPSHAAKTAAPREQLQSANKRRQQQQNVAAANTVVGATPAANAGAASSTLHASGRRVPPGHPRQAAAAETATGDAVAAAAAPVSSDAAAGTFAVSASQYQAAPNPFQQPLLPNIHAAGTMPPPAPAANPFSAPMSEATASTAPATADATGSNDITANSLHSMLARVDEETDDQEALMAALQQTLASIVDTTE